MKTSVYSQATTENNADPSAAAEKEQVRHNELVAEVFVWLALTMLIIFV